MFVEIKESVRKYHVGFEQDNRKKFKKGPNKGRSETVTTCQIFLITEASGPTLVGSGVAVLGKRDKPNSVAGCRYALERALDDAKLGKAANALFWQEFQLRHRRCAGGVIRKDSPMFFGDGSKIKLYPHQRRAMQTIGRMYGGEFVTRQCEDRCHRVGGTAPVVFNVTSPDYGKRLDDLRDLFNNTANHKRWAGGGWPTAEVTAKMQELVAKADYSKLEERLLAHDGVSKVHDEFVIDCDKYKSEFKIDEVLRYNGDSHKVISIHGPLVTIQPLVGDTKKVWDWELTKRSGKRGLIQQWRDAGCSWTGFWKWLWKREDDD